MILAPALVRLLREQRLGSPFDGAEDFVFANALGRGLNYRHVGDAFRAAVRRAGLGGSDRLSLHSLRHGFASLLIAEGLDVVFVSRQLGHTNPNVTLSVYAHLFARREHAGGCQGGAGGELRSDGGRDEGLKTRRAIAYSERAPPWERPFALSASLPT